MYSTVKDDVVSDLKTGASRVKSNVRETAGAVRDDLESAAGSAGRKVREYFDTANKELTHATEAVTGEIRSKPIQSSLIALAAGFVLGALFRR